MGSYETQAVPVLYTRGTHYQVGLNIGKTFGILINDFLNEVPFYNEVALPLYHLPEGKQSYENVLNICNAQYPQYIEEIRGMADGAGLPFHKLFILHVEDLISASELPPKRSDLGCTDIMVNNGQEIVMGHTEDAYPECHGRTYIVQAEILDEDGNTIEQFSSVSYPGFLPGYTMGFNNHGMMHSINTVNPKNRNPNGTPREFIARALLGVKTMEEAIDVVKNSGYGIADGFNVDIHFASKAATDSNVVYSIEVGPSQKGKRESELDILEVPVGDSYTHCNRYLRLPLENTENFFAESTDYRQVTLKGLPKPKNVTDVRCHLSDSSNAEWPVYRVGVGADKGKTVLTGIFETSKKLWSIYTGPASSTSPVAEIYMNY